MSVLQGVVVLDLTRLLPGAAATMWLANFGAEVIKLEQPKTGDYARHILTADGRTNPVFEATNRGKKSVEIDLKDPGGREAFLRLVDTADVLVESFRPGVMDRLGFGYAALAERNPRLVYCSISGYGQTGPWCDRAGHDINYIAMAGLLDMTGNAGGPPAIPGTQIADLAGGSMQAVIGILLALIERQSSGHGQAIDVSMMDGVAALLPVALAQMAAAGRPPVRGSELLTGGFACYNVYRTRDGRWLAVGALEPKFWANLCEALHRPDLSWELYAGGARQAELRRELSAIFGAKTLDDWMALLDGVECCVTPVRTLDEAAADPHFADHPPGLVPRLSRSPANPGGPAPSLGEHNRAILPSIG